MSTKLNLSDYDIGDIGSSNRKSFRIRESSNPLESGILTEKSIDIKIENISNARLLDDKELEGSILKILKSTEYDICLYILSVYIQRL